MTDNDRAWYLATDEGRALIEFTSCLSVSVSWPGEIVNEPIEQGSFASYNKTISPIELNAEMALEGDDATLADALEAVRALHTGMDLFSFLTPEREYRSMTLESFDFARRREDGVGLIVFNLSMREVKQVTSLYTTSKLPASKCKNPSGVNPEKKGTVQTEEVQQDNRTLAQKAMDYFSGGNNNGTNPA